MTAAEWLGLAVEWLALMTGALCLLRWPGRTIGLAVALYVYVAVGPWATWVVLGVVAVGAVGWRVSGRDARRGLCAYRLGAVAVLAAAVALLGRGAVSAGGFVVLAGVAGWMARDRVRQPNPRPVGVPAVADPTPAGGSAWPAAGRRFLGRGSWIVDFAPCERCGSLLVGSGRLESDPGSVAARSVCTGCGTRLVGIEDPTDTGRGLVWIEDPSDGVAEDIA